MKMTMIVVLMVGSVGFAKAQHTVKMAKAKAFTAVSSSEPVASATCNNRMNTALDSNTNPKKQMARMADQKDGRDQKGQ